MSDFKATAIAHELHKDSLVWQDCVTEINAWLEQARDELESVDDINEFRRLQGVAKACRRFLLLPEMLVDAITEEPVLEDEDELERMEEEPDGTC